MKQDIPAPASGSRAAALFPHSYSSPGGLFRYRAQLFHGTFNWNSFGNLSEMKPTLEKKTNGI
jgi:hypothetical protein